MTTTKVPLSSLCFSSTSKIIEGYFHHRLLELFADQIWNFFRTVDSITSMAFIVISSVIGKRKVAFSTQLSGSKYLQLRWEN